MSQLHRRIARQGGNQQAVMGTYHPYGTADTPMIMPMTLVQIGPGGAQVAEMTPLIDPLGKQIPATAPGRWQQLYMAGRR